MKTESKFLLTSDAARELGVCPLTIRTMEKQKRLKAERTAGGYRVFFSKEIERVRAEREQQGAAE